MKEYLFSIAAAGIGCSVLEMFFEGKGSEAVARYIKLVSSLCIICMLIAPLSESVKYLENMSLPSLTQDMPDTEEISEEYDEYIIENARKTMCMRMSGMIFEKTGIIPTVCDIQFNVTKNEKSTEVTVKSVTVEMPQAYVGLEDYISEVTGCEITSVIVKFSKKAEKQE